MSDPRLPFYTDRCKCPTCGEYFSSTYAFDQHRKGPITDRRCLTVAEMREKGFSMNATGHWITKPYSVGDAIGADPYPPLRGDPRMAQSPDRMGQFGPSVGPFWGGRYLMRAQQSAAPRTGIQGSGKSISGNVVECISCRAR